MRKTLYKKAQRHLERNTHYFNNDKNLEKDYLDNYQFKCTREEFYKKIIPKEIENCRIAPENKIEDFTLWFGKYKGTCLYDLRDIPYIKYICKLYRVKNKTLVGQCLLRLSELK